MRRHSGRGGPHNYCYNNNISNINVKQPSTTHNNDYNYYNNIYFYNYFYDTYEWWGRVGWVEYSSRTMQS